jgi:Tfp pilus assembly protein PilN
MKNRVNLYHPRFHPKLHLLTLSSVIGSWLLALILCSALYFYLVSEQKNIESEIAKLEQNKQQQKKLFDELQNTVDNHEVDPILLNEVQINQQLISLKKRLSNKLSGHERLKSHSFSKLMIDLASHNHNGLWLTRINLNGASVVMEGAATNSAIVPKWLSSLGQTDYFKGQEFSDTRLYRYSEQQLNFVISSGKQHTIEKGFDNE